MIFIDAEQLQDGLYNIKDGKIFKYKAKGGTVRTYELRNIVTCRECKWFDSGKNDSEIWSMCTRHFGKYIDVNADDFCSYGKRNCSEKSNNCDTCKWGEWYRNGRDITNMDDESGGCCSWNSKWTPKDEPQTEREGE